MKVVFSASEKTSCHNIITQPNITVPKKLEKGTDPFRVPSWTGDPTPMCSFASQIQINSLLLNLVPRHVLHADERLGRASLQCSHKG